MGPFHPSSKIIDRDDFTIRSKVLPPDDEELSGHCPQIFVLFGGGAIPAASWFWIPIFGEIVTKPGNSDLFGTYSD